MIYKTRILDASDRAKLMEVIGGKCRNEIASKGKVLSGDPFTMTAGKFSFVMELNDNTQANSIKQIYDREASKLNMEASSKNKVTKTKIKGSYRMGNSLAYGRTETIGYRYSLQYS